MKPLPVIVFGTLYAIASLDERQGHIEVAGHQYQIQQPWATVVSTSSATSNSRIGG